MVAQDYSSRTWKVKTRRLYIQGHPSSIHTHPAEKKRGRKGGKEEEGWREEEREGGRKEERTLIKGSSLQVTACPSISS